MLPYHVQLLHLVISLPVDLGFVKFYHVKTPIGPSVPRTTQSKSSLSGAFDLWSHNVDWILLLTGFLPRVSLKQTPCLLHSPSKVLMWCLCLPTVSE